MRTTSSSPVKQRRSGSRHTNSSALSAIVVPSAIKSPTRVQRLTRSYRRAPKFCPTNVVTEMPNAFMTIQIKPSILPIAAQAAIASVPKPLMLA